MRSIVTYSGRTLEFLDLADRTLHLKPRQTLELDEKELEQIKESRPDVFGNLFVHEFTANQKKKLGKSKATKSFKESKEDSSSKSKKPVRPSKDDSKKPKASDSDKS